MRWGICRRLDRFGFGVGHTWCKAYKGIKQPIAWVTDRYANLGGAIAMSKASAEAMLRKMQANDPKHEYKLYKVDAKR